MKKWAVILIVLLGFLILGLYLSFSFISVSGTSMEPSLENGDKLLVSKIAYLFDEPKRGDIVLVQEDDKKWLKRIIAKPGQLIQIKDGEVILNGEVLDEVYVKNDYTFASQSIVLEDNQYYVMGDNREPNQSIDSRIWGPITGDKILGKAIYTISGGYKTIKNPFTD